MFVLFLPLNVLLDFGIHFTIYVRGAGGSTNIVIEILFDLIGVLVVFTRFVVQNIRFVLIFSAYFELFEWVYSSPFINFLDELVTVGNSGAAQQAVTAITLDSTFYFYLLTFLFELIGYAYYFVHLLILLFIQLGAYFLISFWLFFFFYTCFFATKEEKYFFYKRYL
jgi:hypothetical protein